MHLTVAHLKEFFARPECRDDMPVVIENLGIDFTECNAESVRIDTHDQFVISVDAENTL